MSQNIKNKIKENIFNQFVVPFLRFVDGQEYMRDAERYFWDYYNRGNSYKRAVIETLNSLCFDDVDLDYIELEYILNVIPGIRELSYPLIDSMSLIFDVDSLYDSLYEQIEGAWRNITELGGEYITEHIDQILKLDYPICNKLSELEDDAEYKQKQADKNAQYKEWGVPTDEEVFGEKEWGDW